MSSLFGDFETELAPPDALTACVDALDGLGWRVDSVEAQRVECAVTSGPGDGGVTIEVELTETGDGSDIRLIGTGSEESGLDENDLGLVLDRASDAIGEQIDKVEVPEAKSETAEEESRAGEKEPPASEEESRAGEDQPSTADRGDWTEEPEQQTGPHAEEPAQQAGQSTEKEAREAATGTEEPQDGSEEQPVETQERQELPAAGWFPDPYGGERQRYWDGENWTEHVHPPADEADTGAEVAGDAEAAGDAETADKESKETAADKESKETAPAGEGTKAAAVADEPSTATAVADHNGENRSESKRWLPLRWQSVAVGVLVFCVGGAVGAVAKPGDTRTKTTERVQTQTITQTQPQSVDAPGGGQPSSGPEIAGAAASSGGSSGAKGAAPSTSATSTGSSSVCDPSYAPICLDPTVSDYDCLGTGDGPKFVDGPVTVVGVDHWKLDEADNDSVACE